MGECITLTKTIGLFITMNPVNDFLVHFRLTIEWLFVFIISQGYLGRTELRKFLAGNFMI